MHEIPGWDTLFRAGFDGKGVVVLLLGPGDDGKGAGCGISTSDVNYRHWENPGEVGDGKERNGVDDDGNGAVDDVKGVDFSQAWDEGTRTWSKAPQQESCNLLEFTDYAAGATRLGGGWRSLATMGMFPGVRFFPIAEDGSDDPNDGVGARQARYIQALIDANVGRRFIVVRKQAVRHGWMPITQEDCSAYSRDPPSATTPALIADTRAYEAIRNTLLVGGRVGGDWYWPYCEDPATWIGMGLVDANLAPRNQIRQEFPINSVQDNGYYQIPGATQAPPPNRRVRFPITDRSGTPLPGVTYSEVKRFVAPNATAGKNSAFSFQYVAPLVYLVPLMQMLIGKSVPSEDQVREMFLACASKPGRLPGPDGVGGWDTAIGYGLPDLGCVMERAADRFGGDLDGDGITGSSDNCPWTPNPGQEDRLAPGGPGDACDPRSGSDREGGPRWGRGSG
jgi:hypothetical protein